MVSAYRFTVHCGQVIGRAPRLSQAVMGGFHTHLLRTGAKLQKTLEDIADTPLLRRTMGTLNDGIGLGTPEARGTGVYREGADGRPYHDFALLDQVVDAIAGPKSIPFFGISFLPGALSIAETRQSADRAEPELPPEAGEGLRKVELTQPWMRPDRTPPKDYDRWYDLVHALVGHMAERHGERVVSEWHWDFWNEPDLQFYWLGTHAEFFKLYDYTAAAVRAALPRAKVGGCGVAHPEHPIFREFLEHCTVGTNHFTGGRGTPLDFITFHQKGGPTGRLGDFGNPWEATGYERRHPSLTDIIDSTREAMRTIASLAGTKGLPVFLTECDVDWGTGTSIYHNPNMHYRNSEYFAAFQCTMNKRMHDLRIEFPDNPIEATFLDTFYIPGSRIFEGQRTLITGELIDKPILNALRLLGQLGKQRLAVTEPSSVPVEAMGTVEDDGSLRVMAVNWHDDFDYCLSHPILIRLEEVPAGSWRCRHLRIDHDHSNAYTTWLSMERPVVPSDEQLATIQARMGLERMEPDRVVHGIDGVIELETVMPPHSVSLWILEKAGRTPATRATA